MLDADADNTFLDAVVSAGLLCWDDDDLFIFDELLLFPWEEDILLSILFFFHKGVQVNLAPEVDDDLGVIGEPGGIVVLLVAMLAMTVCSLQLLFLLLAGQLHLLLLLLDHGHGGGLLLLEGHLPHVPPGIGSLPSTHGSLLVDFLSPLGRVSGRLSSW